MWTRRTRLVQSADLIHRRIVQGAQRLFLRSAALKAIPAHCVMPSLRPLPRLAAREGRLHVEIVAHCWNYAHLLAYQLSSLVKYRARDLDLTYTLFFCTEDRATLALLRRFRERELPGLHWNPQPMPRDWLLRRAIGRNRAALATSADWIWFTDCDVLFREGCLDSLAASLQGRRDALVYPRHDRCTPLLSPDDPMLRPHAVEDALLDIDPARFMEHEFSRAQGAYQITHGDAARARGYCRQLSLYQLPSATWRKTREDRAFRWLLGTNGVPIEVDNLYRIRHRVKGRYDPQRPLASGMRGGIRRTRAWLQESWKRPAAHDRRSS